MVRERERARERERERERERVRTHAHTLSVYPCSFPISLSHRTLRHSAPADEQWYYVRADSGWTYPYLECKWIHAGAFYQNDFVEGAISPFLKARDNLAFTQRGFPSKKGFWRVDYLHWMVESSAKASLWFSTHQVRLRPTHLPCPHAMRAMH